MAMDNQISLLQLQNPTINLGTIKLHDAAALQQLNWSDLDPNEVLPQLLAYQRLWRLHSDPKVVEALLELGISSAHQIAAMGLGKFRKLAGAALRKIKPAPRLVSDIHSAAQQTTTAVAQYAVHTIPSEFMSAASFDTRTSGLPDFHGESPTYRSLFGPITAGPCNDCDSIFSPAAYFVDLMQLIDEYITYAPGNSIPTALQLQTRRPDLWNLLLNCKNTVKQYTYLELANEIMASTLKPYLNKTNPWLYAAENFFPFQLPYNKPLEEIRAYIAHFGLSLQEVYAALGRPGVDVAREESKILPELYNLLKSGTVADLESVYGLNSLSDLEQVAVFLQQTGLSLSELSTLLYQDAPDAGKDKIVGQNPAILTQYYINASLNNVFLTLEQSDKVLNLKTYDGVSTYGTPTDEAWAALNAVIRLSNQLNWSYPDVDWALKTIEAAQPSHWAEPEMDQLAGVIQLAQKLGQPIDALTGLWYDLKTYGKGSGKSDASFWDQTFNSPKAFYNPDNLAHPPAYRPEYNNNPYFTDPVLFLDITSTAATDSQLRLSLSQSLNITEPDLTAILDYIHYNSDALINANLLESVTAPQGVTVTPTMVGLSVRNMSLIYRMAKLPQWLKLPVDQFVALLPILGLIGFGTVKQVLSIEKTVGWLQQNQLNVFAYSWLLGNGLPEKSAYTLNETQRTNLEKSLISGRQATMLTPRELESKTISHIDALDAYAQLIDGKVIDLHGLVLHERPLTPTTIANVMAQSALLRSKYQIINPLQEAITFDGHSYVTLPFDVAAIPEVVKSNSLTFTAFIRCQEWPESGTWDSIFSTPTDPAPAGQSDNGYKGPQLTLVGDNPGWMQTAYSDVDHGWHAQSLVQNFQLNQWYHIAWVNANGQWTVYVNGIPSATYASGASTIYQNLEGITYFGYGLHGQMLHATLWSAGLSASAIKDLMYNAPDADAPNLIGYWAMNQDTGANIPGIKGADGTLTGGSWGPLSGLPIPAEVDFVLNKVVEAETQQNALALQKLSSIYRIGNTQMHAIHTLTAARTRSNLAFNGTTAFASIPFAPALSPGSFTLSFWLNIWQNTQQNDLQSIWDGMVTASGIPQGFRICLGKNGSLVFVLSSDESNGITTIYSGNWLALGQWYYIGVTYDGSYVNWMINGQMASALPGYRVTGYNIPTGGNSYIGSHYCQNGQNVYNYQLANVRFWNAALSTSALQDDYHALRPDPSNLIAWWPLDAGTGALLYDFGPYGFNATINPEAENTIVWQNLHVNALLSPLKENQADIVLLAESLALNVALARKFALDTADIVALTTRPIGFGMTGPIVRGTQYSQEMLESLADLRWLKTQYPASKDQWLKVMAIYDPNDNSTALSLVATLTGWSVGQVSEVLAGVPNTGLDSLKGLTRLCVVLDMAAHMGVQPSYLVNLGVLSNLTVVGNTTIAGTSESNWSIYNALSSSLSDALEAQYSKDQLESALGKIKGSLWEKERDILAALLLHFLKGVVNDVNSLQDLYEYLLVDVKMAANVKISRIEQALDGLQLYVNRCMNGLETSATSYIPKRWWTCMGSYRDWQANREVYLYPENYVDPSLRKAQTPLFQSFVNTLNQGQLSKSNIEKALGQYIEGMAVIANLKIVDSYARKITGPNGNVGTELYVLGRGHQDPPTYFLRRGFLTSDMPAAWTPWEQLDFSIGANTATIAYAFNRVYIFWVQQTRKSINDASAGTLNIIEASIQYTFRKMDGTWLQPQTLTPSFPIQVSNTSGILIPTTLNFTGWRMYYNYPESTAWNAVRVFVLPQTGLESACILVTYGDWVVYDPLIAVPSNAPDCASPEANAWYKMLLSAQGASKTLGQNAKTSLVPPFRLFEDGRASLTLIGAKDDNSANLTAATRQLSFLPNAEMFSCTKSVLEKLPGGNFKRFNGEETAFYPMTLFDSLITDGITYLRIADFNWFYNGYPPYEYNNSAEIQLAIVAVTDWLGGSRKVTSFGGNNSSYGQVLSSETLQFSGQCSMACWVMPRADYTTRSGLNSSNPSYQIIFSNSLDPDGASNKGGYALYLYQSSESADIVAGVRIGDGTTTYEKQTTTSFELNTWNHVAAVWNKTLSLLTLYINGVAESLTIEEGFALGGYNNNCAVGIGLDFGGSFNGYMSELLVTGIALSQDEVKLLYSGTTGSLLGQVEPFLSDVVPVSNRTGIFFGATGKENFLCLPASESGFAFVEDSLTPVYQGDDELLLTFSQPMIPAEAPKFEFHRFGTSTISQFIEQLVKGGPDLLFSLAMQCAAEPSFIQNYDPNSARVMAPQSDLVDFSGPMQEYLWELFFYIPLYVGNLLQTQQQFSIARKWYDYVFNPSGINGITGYWPLDGKLTASVGTDGSLTGSGDPWVVSQFPDGSMRKVFNTTNNGIQLDPALVAQGDTVSICFWLYGNFPDSNYALSDAIISANAASFPDSDTSTRLIEIFLLYAGANSSSTSTNAYWEAGNDETGWDSKYFADSLDDYNGAWHFFAFTKNAATGNLTAYKDGALWFSGTDFTRGLDFPAVSFDVKDKYNALLTELSIWSIELSANEVAMAYQLNLHNFWNFRPFVETTPATLAQTLTQAPAQLAIYHYDPFDPDALAAIRWGAWEKNVFMAYIHNLIGWGDQLFSGDTWEQISEATMLYVVADSLLGVPPKRSEKLDIRPEVTYGMIESQYGEGNIPEFLIDMETRVTAGQTFPKGGAMPAGTASILNGYFCIPENTQLTQLWGIIANRLYKIRHGLNLQGQPVQPALFGPPLNPSTLVDGGAYGAAGPEAAGAAEVPYYRFDQTLQLAKNFTGQVVNLGNELLAALEKQDAESLSQLRQTQESAIFNMTIQAKADMVNQLLSTQQGLQYTLQSAQTELATISAWAEQVLLPQESLALKEAGIALGLNIGVAAIKAVSSLAYLIPDIFGLADGGMDFGDSVKVIAEAMATTAELLNEGAGLNREIAGYTRREQEWDLRLKTISYNIGQINAQIAANQYAIAAAEQDYSITQTQYQQSQDVLNFLQTKFTNEDLYVWMAGQLSNLYYQAYQMAVELAQQAQSCYQYELSSDDTFLSGNPWNDQYKGLLAGDSLSISLAQMEKAYHDNNSRYQEIHKTFSLMQKDPQALLNLKKNGSCTFSFTELDFDLDFPGHYNRKIASIAVTIPAVVGPYQNLNATLIQTGNQVLTKPDISGVKYLLGLGGVPKSGSIRSNWAPNQQISISTGINDAGLFQVNFNDPQYLPFEGTGAVSTWELIMPKAANAFDFAAITDVIFQIEYTASPGGQTFAKQITQLGPLKDYQGTLYLSLKQQYSSAWYAFLSTYSLNFNLLRGQFPNNLATDSLNLGKNGDAYLALVLADPAEYSDLPTMALNSAEPNWDPGTGAAAIGTANNFRSANELSWQVAMNFTAGGSDLLDGDRIDPKALLDVILIVPFGGQLDWGM